MKKPADELRAWLYVLPALLLLVVYLVVPTLETLRMSFQGGTGFTSRRFVGLSNYVQLLTRDPLFLNLTAWPPSGALVNNLLWVVAFTSGTLIFGMLIAVLANGRRLESLVKSTIFLPMMISATAAAVIARFLFSPEPSIGVLNAVLTALVPRILPVPWLGSARVVNGALIATGIWIWTGLSMTVLSAAYKSLDPQVLEAARVDGAGSWQRFWRISLPMLAQPIAFVTITMIINSLKLIDLVLVMTGGGPAGASRVIGYTFYWEVFNNDLVGYGSAVAILMLVLLIPLMVVQVRRIRKQEAG